MTTLETPQSYPLYAKIEKIPGWLMKITAFRSMDILDWQAANNIKGNLMEIGVFCGRYLSLLLDSAIRHGDSVLGIDTFEFAPESRVRNEIHNVFGEKADHLLTLWNKQSSTILPNEIIPEIGRPRFISIDGAHDYENVFGDLTLSEQIVSKDGLIAVDDFLNPLALGVNAAVNQFLSRPRSVVPVAYVSNKLFLAHRSRENDYRQAFEEMIMACGEPQSLNFRDKILKGRHHVEQDFYGHKVLLS